jgi:hypothetical protein
MSSSSQFSRTLNELRASNVHELIIFSVVIIKLKCDMGQELCQVFFKRMSAMLTFLTGFPDAKNAQNTPDSGVFGRFSLFYSIAFMH